MATRKYTHNTEIECIPPPFILSLSSVFSKQHGLLGGEEAFFLFSNQKLVSTEISDKQTSQAEAEFEKSSKISQQKHNVKWNINDNSKFNNEGIAHG